MGSRSRSFLRLLLVVGLPACAASSAQDPVRTLRLYGKALEESRAEDAYRTLSDEARKNISFAEFQRRLREHPEDAKELGKALAQPSHPPVVTATVTSAEGEVLRLVLEDGRWRIEADALDLYSQETPRKTVAGFLRALEHKRYDILLRYVPDAHRADLSADVLKRSWEGDEKAAMAQVLTSLKQALPVATIEEAGERASLLYGAGTMRLVREQGLWKIEDFD